MAVGGAGENHDPDPAVNTLGPLLINLYPEGNCGPTGKIRFVGRGELLPPADGAPSLTRNFSLFCRTNLPITNPYVSATALGLGCEPVATSTTDTVRVEQVENNKAILFQVTFTRNGANWPAAVIYTITVEIDQKQFDGLDRHLDAAVKNEAVRSIIINSLVLNINRSGDL